MEISLPQALTTVLATNWTKINDYHVYFSFPTSSKAHNISDAMINIAIKSLTLPAFTQKSIEVYTGGQWFVANGNPDLARVECTFRDYNNFTLYKAFVDLYERALGYYKNESAVRLRVAIGDVSNESTVAIFEELIIENVSQINFDNTTEDQIAEFSVTFRGKRASIPNNLYYNDVGSDLKTIK